MCCIGEAVIAPWTLSPTVGSNNRLVTSTTLGFTTSHSAVGDIAALQTAIMILPEGDRIYCGANQV